MHDCPSVCGRPRAFALVEEVKGSELVTFCILDGREIAGECLERWSEREMTVQSGAAGEKSSIFKGAYHQPMLILRKAFASKRNKTTDQ